MGCSGRREAMNSESTQPAAPGATTETNGAPADSRQEVEQLREALRRTERERDDYRDMLYGLLKRQFTAKDVVIPDESDCLTFDQFVHELEEVVHRDASGGAK
jgi:hypothetical protein